MGANFILFQDRLLNTDHIVTLAPPRPDGGKHIIEARVVGGVSYVEHHDDADEAAGRYLAIAAELLGDPTVARGVRRPGTAAAGGGGGGALAEVTPLPTRE